MRGKRWLGLCIAAAATTVVGLAFQYLGPNIFPIGKGFRSSPLLILLQAPLALIAIGSLGIVVGAAGIAGSPWRVAVTTADTESPVRRTPVVTTTRLADAAAYIGLIVASAAAAVILIEFALPTLAQIAGVGPCNQSPTVVCFSAHPDFYQELSPGSGSYTTPVSRFYDDILHPAVLAAWPLAVAATVASAIALASGTGRPGVAVIGLSLGSITVVVMAAQSLAFLLLGGD